MLKLSIQQILKKIAATEEGYISNFSIDCNSYKVLKEGTGSSSEENHEEGDEGHEH